MPSGTLDPSPQSPVPPFDPKAVPEGFASRIIHWQLAHGRHALPWQNTRDPYRIWLSEIMLQQTQVSTVIPYYERFMTSFPDVATLAAAPIDRVLEHWAGLGYYRRAHHLHAAAKAVVERHGGAFPADLDALAALPGVGRSTAAAIAAFAFGAKAAILEGNVKRVLARHRAIDGYPGAPAVQNTLWALADALLPDDDIERYTQGMMDLGATVCTRSAPACPICPVNDDCLARLSGRVDELPVARPTRQVPRRAIRVLVVEHDDRILLEKRPPTGLWSGLLSLPELALDDDVPSALARRFGLVPTASSTMPTLEHAFTHFTLTLHPQRVRVGAVDRVAESASIVWLGRAELAGAALPAPIRRLLAG